MRENRTSGSEGGEPVRFRLSYPYHPWDNSRSGFIPRSCWDVARLAAETCRLEVSAEQPLRNALFWPNLTILYHTNTYIRSAETGEISGLEWF